MKKKILVWTFMFLLSIMMVSAVDDTSWSSAGKDQYGGHWIPYTASITDFTSSCFVSGSSDTQPVVDNLDGDVNNTPEIVIVRNDNLYVYDISCNELDTFNDVDLDNRQPSIFDSLDCISGKGIFLLTKDSVEQWCFDGTNLTLENQLNLTTGFVDDFKAISMANISGVPKGAFLTDDNGTDYISVCTFNGGVGCISATEYGLSWSGLDKLPLGSIDLDGDLDFPIYSPHNKNMWVVDFSLNRYNVSVSTGAQGISGIEGVYDEFIRDDVIFRGTTACTSGCPDGNYVHLFLSSYSGVTTTIMSRGTGADTHYIPSNIVQLGEGGDVCVTFYVSAGYAPSSHSGIQCANSNGDITLQATSSSSYGLIDTLVASDLNGDAKADFLTEEGVFYYVGQYAISHQDYAGMDNWAYALDLDGDIYRDLLIYGSSGLNISLTQTQPIDYDLNLHIFDCVSGSPIGLADVEVIGESLYGITTTSGNVTFEGVGEGNFDVEVNKYPYDITLFEDLPSSGDGDVIDLCLGGEGETIVISDIVDDTCGLSASVFWETQVATDTKLTWWIDTEERSDTYMDETTKQHSIQLFDLEAGQLYFYEVESCYHGENCAIQGGETFVTGVESDLCSGNCNFPCIFYDDFSYTVPLSSKGWFISPSIYDDLAPFGGELCINVDDGVWGTDSLRHDTRSGAGYPIYSHKINFKVEENTTFSFTIRYQGRDGNLVSIVEIGSNPTNSTHSNLFTLHNDEIGEYSSTNNPTIFFTNDEYHELEIIQYWDPLNRKFYNSTSEEVQTIYDETYAVILDGDLDTAWFNLDFYNELPDQSGTLLDDLIFSYWTDGDLCLDDVAVYVGTTFNATDLYDFVDTLEVDDIKGCWNTETGDYECLVSGCQECCESHDGSFRLNDILCAIGKYVGYKLDNMVDWIFNNILIFLVLVLLLVLTIPVILKFYEIKSRFRQ